MAMSQNISQIDENPVFLSIVKKDKKKEKKKQLELASALKFLESRLADVKEGVKTSITNTKPSNPSIQDKMAEMELIIQMLQVLIAKYSNNRAESNEIISKEQVQAAKQQLQDITKKIAEIDSKEKHDKFWDAIAHAAEDILGGVAVLGGILLGQPELVIMGALSIAAGTGLLNDMSKGIADIAMAAGVPKNKAEMIGSIATVVLVLIASLATLSALSAGEEIGEVAAESALNIGEDASEDVGALEQFTNMIKESKLGRGFKAVMKALGPKGRVALMSLTSSTTGTNLVQNFYLGGMHMPGTMQELEQEHEKTLEKLGIALEVVFFVTSIFLGLGMNSASEGAEGMLKLGSLADKLGVSTSTLAKVLTKAQDFALIGGTLVESSATLAEAVVVLQEGSLQAGLAENRAGLELLKICLELLSDNTSAEQKHEADAEKAQQVDDRSATKLANGYQAFAKVSTQDAPV